VDDGDGDEEVLDSLPQPDLGEVPLDAPLESQRVVYE
jgi:hypothetical protein